MSSDSRTGRGRRGMWWVGVGLAAGAALAVYLGYFTPQKRAARHHLGEADDKAAAALDGRMKPVRDLFAAGRKGAPGFAREVLGFNGKWQLVRGLVARDDYKAFVAGAFARHVLDPDDLKGAIEGSCAAYLGDLDSVEGEMLVRLRADLADAGGVAGGGPRHLESQEAFAREYRALAARVSGQAGADLAATGGRELVSAVVAEMAAAAAVQAARAAAVEMGVSGGVLSSGAASMAATLGVGLVISIIIDYVLDALFKAVGYDPEAKVAAAVVDSLDKMEAALVRDAGLRARVGVGSHGALRAEMEKLAESHSRRRREAVRLMLEGGVR